MPMRTVMVKLSSAVRWISSCLLPLFLCLTALVVLVTQFTELASRKEILSLTSFVTTLTFSALAFNWSRVSSTFCPEVDLRIVYHCGVDFLLASMMALISAFFSWLGVGEAGIPVFLNPVLFAMHWFFLLLTMLLSLMAFLQLLQVAGRATPTLPQSERDS